MVVVQGEHVVVVDVLESSSLAHGVSSNAFVQKYVSEVSNHFVRYLFTLYTVGFIEVSTVLGSIPC